MPSFPSLARMQHLALAVLFLSVPTLVSAATYIVPPDADLIREADAIAIVTIQSSRSYFADDGSIHTDYAAIVESPLKGAPSAGSSIVLTQRGGSVGQVAMGVSSEPAFLPGERALLMMRGLASGRFTTWPGELGKFSFVRDAGSRRLLMRGATEGEIAGWDVTGRRHNERPREEAAFLRYIEAVVAGESATADYEVEESASLSHSIAADNHVSASDYCTRITIGPKTQCGRWPSGLPMKTVGTQTAVSNLTSSINAARGGWNGDSNSSISITNVGTGSGTYAVNDHENLIFFDQPNSGPLSGGVVGQANFWVTSSENTNGSDTYFNTTDCDIIIEAGFSGAQFEAILGHEMGHCIGFRHSNQPGSGQTTSTTNALMNSSAPSGANLRPWDADAASHVYGSTSCSSPSISVHPQNKTITPPATSTSLSVTATGSGPLTYQWYVGDSGDDDTPTGTNSNSITVSPVATTNYWVRVTGQCPPVANSNTATVTVGGCAPPQISSFSNDRTITEGTGTQLTVTATGTALHYQWYIGAAGNTAQPTGNDNKNLIVSPTTTTSYWVRVSGACAPTADSGAILVTVVTCPNVIIGTPTKTPSGSNVILSIEASSTAVGSLSYAWFLGNTPGSGGAQVGGTKSISVPVTAEVKNYWVRVSNTCNRSVVSSLVTVTSCTLPGIATQPVDQTIQIGGSAMLSLTLTGDGLGITVTWYRGLVPDKTIQVGTGNSVNTGPLTTTTSYWAAVQNSCGEVSTRTAVITVNECNAPVVTTQPASQEVKNNTSVSLSVVATGTAVLQYQWYEGAKGDTSKPLPGAIFSTFTSANLFDSTSFWVRVSNTCGIADSNAAQITVANGRRRAVRK